MGNAFGWVPAQYPTPDAAGKLQDAATSTVAQLEDLKAFLQQHPAVQVTADHEQGSHVSLPVESSSTPTGSDLLQSSADPDLMDRAVQRTPLTSVNLQASAPSVQSPTVHRSGSSTSLSSIGSANAGIQNPAARYTPRYAATYEEHLARCQANLSSFQVTP
ncbi:hypothetical protein WJX79_006172 [Trebouxia sp. C0005]